MQEYARVCQSMPKYARVCQSMPENARVCQSMPEYARVKQSMPEYARVCQSMPDYARVCSRDQREWVFEVREVKSENKKLSLFFEKCKVKKKCFHSLSRSENSREFLTILEKRDFLTDLFRESQIRLLKQMACLWGNNHKHLICPIINMLCST